MWNTHYDVIIVGAGIAGSALAHALSRSRQHPLRIALLERSLAEPDRIVGELLQPGGVLALQKLGLEDCLDGIDAIPVNGYCVVNDRGEQVRIPYPEGYEGRSFHHGRFVNALREKAKKAEGVDVIEATVTELLECPFTKKILGVKATRRSSPSPNQGEEQTEPETWKESFFSDIVIIADGCFSNFRSQILKPPPSAPKPSTRSHFLGLLLSDAQLPYSHHGTVVLVRHSGPVLLYQISTHSTRILIDVQTPLPTDLKSHILSTVLPQMPSQLQAPLQLAIEQDRLRRMPNTFLPPSHQGHKEGAILIGDAWNMRHPLTGGGMTVALNDVVILSELLKDVPLGDWEKVSGAVKKWYWRRKPLAATVNILSVALYDLFSAEDEALEVLRTGCFKYFELGGECINGPVSLLAATAPSPLLLARHFFAVALYALYVMFAHPRPVSLSVSDEKPVLKAPGFEEYPALMVKSVRVFWTACIVFGPLLLSEIR